ncbi:glycine/betaine ABC transporter ATPase [Azospirillum thiophilum]|uniref:Quaternary amine transport ATP-binding protein n=2 Tax=Azospirillum thiophilum TaxID=528244 RepID=A0AAC8ZUR9_9PROT|nr:glycine betaine/L-proline ABC transporter ATP-binding protein [Azospirillum thiophilum]ALG72820.1 glycine/betaine ABC transporter ATPase [Azospirillum thiophilum]KJR64263.1 glycine/betaine ABC transporter ATPase [Azospirillum thiophilum]
MTERLRVENLYKVFSKSPEPALRMLKAGVKKTEVLAKTGIVVGLSDVSLSVPTGGIYMVMGLSGSGKSTLARCINRLNEPSAGRILLDGRDIVAAGEAELREIRRKRISMVFQHFALLPNRTVAENTEFGLKLQGVSPQVRRRRAEEVLSIVGLARWGNHYPHELSGGMRQRVGLARALATDADVLIMDEAFSALDPLIRTEMQDELLRLQRTLKKTILFITHDFQEALKLGTRIAIMADGELVREGTPQSIVLDPGSDYVAAFTREVDRSRLFDARSAMIPVAPVQLAGGLCLAETGDGAGLVLDDGGHVVGALDAAALRDLRDGIPFTDSGSGTLRKDFVTVRERDSLLDAARAHRAGRPMAVVDDEGRLIGTLAADSILAGIAAAPPQTAGGLHA